MSKSNGFLELLELVVDKGATDLHLKVPSPPVLRIDGVLMPQESFPPFTPENIQTTFEQITTQEQRAVFYADCELDFAYSVPGLARFRVNALQQRGTTSLAFHLVPFVIPSIDELGLPRICKELILKPRGLILITGPVGSGKSTTLAAMINHLNENERRNVITIEDPIEYLFRDKKCIIRQREVGGDTKSFHSALMRALRHDPDVVVIGETRDLETVSTAITAAETGHLVLATLHTIDAAQSIDRIIDMFPPNHQHQIRLQLSQVIEAVLSQTLLPRIGGGRIAAFEVMFATSVIRRLIRDEKIFEIPANIEMGRLEGMQTLDQALAILVKRGIVTREDALMKTSDPLKLSELLGPQRETFGLETVDEAVALYSEPDKLKASPS
jgi:twitching motility protein PilT